MKNLAEKVGWDESIQIRKYAIALVFLTIILMLFLAPMPILEIVRAGNSITITFDPDSSFALDVSPSAYNLSTIYANSSESTGGATFTVWNNGTQGNMTTDIQITSGLASLSINESGDLLNDDTYAVYLIGGTISGVNNWVKQSTTIQLDNDIDMYGSKTFGFTLYVSNLSSNYSWQSLTMTLTASG